MVRSQVPDEAFPLAEIVGDTLERVIADPVVKTTGLLVDREQPAIDSGDRHSSAGVRMHHRINIRAASENPTVNCEPGGVHLEVRLGQLVAFKVDLDQAGCRDLLEEHAVWVEKERVVLPRHPRGDMRGPKVGPSLHGGDPICRR